MMYRIGGVLLIGCAMGCGSSSDSAPATTPGPVANTPVLKIQIFAAEGVPLEGASVALFAPDGTQISEGVSAADGLASLPGAELTDAPNTIVGWKAGHSVEVGVEFNKKVHAATSAQLGRKVTDPPVFFVLPLVTKNPKLSGAVSGLTNPNATILASSSVGNIFFGPHSNFALRVQPKQAGTIIGAEVAQTQSGRSITQTIDQWAQWSHPAITADTSFPLDFGAATKLTSKKAKTTFEVTGGADGPLGGTSTAFGFILTTGKNLQTLSGLVTTAAPNADGTAFDVEYEWVEPGLPGQEPLILARLGRQDGAMSQRFAKTWPTEGMVFKDFDMPLPVTVTKQSLYEPISLEGAPPNSRRVIVVEKSTGDTVFRIFVPESSTATSVKIPKLPAAAEAQLTPSLVAKIITVREFYSDGLAQYFTQSRPLTLTR